MTESDRLSNVRANLKLAIDALAEARLNLNELPPLRRTGFDEQYALLARHERELLSLRCEFYNHVLAARMREGPLTPVVDAHELEAQRAANARRIDEGMAEKVRIKAARRATLRRDGRA